MSAPAQPDLRQQVFAWLEDDDPELTSQQIEYNVAAGELIQLGAYGHCTYWPIGELHPKRYLDVLHAAQDRFENAVLGLVQPLIDQQRAAGMREAAAMLRHFCPDHGDVRDGDAFMTCQCAAAEALERDAAAVSATTT